MSSLGLFGKLPGHGDFIQRQLPSSFVAPWDEWLQRSVYGARELIGDRWLDYYLTSPIWRFAMTAGAVDGQAWAGILVPSVDSVGRYFPLTIVAPVNMWFNPFSFQVEGDSWYQQLSDIAVDALQKTYQADTLMEQLPAGLQVGADEIAVTSTAGTLIATGDISEIAASYPSLLEQLCQSQCPSFSLWWCNGSQHLAPTTQLSLGLPEPPVYCSMLGASLR